MRGSSSSGSTRHYSADGLVVYRQAEDALLTLAGEWKERYELIQAAAPGQERTPPVMIIVCDNTDIAEHYYVACDTDTWEQAAVFQLEKLVLAGRVQSYARNDHLEFSIPYELYGRSHGYEPDFLIRLSNGVTVVLEIKGQAHDE